MEMQIPQKEYPTTCSNQDMGNKINFRLNIISQRVKLKTSMKEKRFATIEKIKEKSKQELLAIQKSVRFGKNAGISILYLSEVILKGMR